VKFELTDVQRDIQKAAREFAEKEFDPDLALELEKEERFPEPLFKKACQLGFIGIDYPEQYGGQSLGLFENVLVIEEFARKDSGIGISLSLADLGSCIILKHGDESQKNRFLPPITLGRAVSSVVFIDPSHSAEEEPSIAEAMDDSGEYIINKGESQTPHGSFEGTFIVLGTGFDPGKILALIVEKDREGVMISGSNQMMGMKISSIRKVVLNRVKVPADHVIRGRDGEKNPLMTYHQVHRIRTSAQALGISQGAFERAVRHAREREQFGRKIAQFQGIQFMLAELYTRIEAVRSLVYRVAFAYDVQSPDLEVLTSVTRLLATEVAVKTTVESIQIHGGVGLMKEYSIERMFRDAKTIQNYEETNLVQKALIARKIVFS